MHKSGKDTIYVYMYTFFFLLIIVVDLRDEIGKNTECSILPHCQVNCSSCTLCFGNHFPDFTHHFLPMSSYFYSYAQKAESKRLSKNALLNYMKKNFLILLFDFPFPFILKIIKKKMMPAHFPEVGLESPLNLPDF